MLHRLFKHEAPIMHVIARLIAQFNPLRLSLLVELMIPRRPQRRPQTLAKGTAMERTTR